MQSWLSLNSPLVQHERVKAKIILNNPLTWLGRYRLTVSFITKTPCNGRWFLCVVSLALLASARTVLLSVLFALSDSTHTNVIFISSFKQLQVKHWIYVKSMGIIQTFSFQTLNFPLEKTKRQISRDNRSSHHAYCLTISRFVTIYAYQTLQNSVTLVDCSVCRGTG